MHVIETKMPFKYIDIMFWNIINGYLCRKLE